MHVVCAAVATADDAALGRWQAAYGPVRLASWRVHYSVASLDRRPAFLLIGHRTPARCRPDWASNKLSPNLTHDLLVCRESFSLDLSRKSRKGPAADGRPAGRPLHHHKVGGGVASAGQTFFPPSPFRWFIRPSQPAIASPRFISIPNFVVNGRWPANSQTLYSRFASLPLV